jgi:transmembrane sensor
MTIDDPQPDAGDLRAQAATWFARMRGPDADRPAFEAWLAADPHHREAYSRIAEVFGIGKKLRPDSTLSAPPRAPRHRHKARTVLASTLLAIGIAGVSFVVTHRDAPLPGYVRTASLIGADRSKSFERRLRTDVGQIRSVRLPDGSTVTLDTGTVLDIAFNTLGRDLRLVRGRARFDVAHDGRSFVVAAGAGTVTARGTIFDVGLRAGGAVDVRLLRGKIDVAVPVRASGVSAGRVERLTPGQQVAFSDDTLSDARSIAQPIDLRWPAAELDCDHVALSTVISAANRYSTTRIVLADPTLGTLRISGTFRIDDPVALAARLALLFNLEVDHADAARLVLHAA